MYSEKATDWVSIVIPIFNSELFLKKCLESIKK